MMLKESSGLYVYMINSVSWILCSLQELWDDSDIYHSNQSEKSYIISQINVDLAGH